MSVFPGLESALDAAAHRRFGRRRAWSWGRWVAAPALAVCGAALIVALLPGDSDPGRAVGAAKPPVTVPAATLARSAALAAAPVPQIGARVEHAQLRTIATELAARVPYPPGAGESMGWESTPASPTDMASINDRAAVQFLVEYRAACTWATFWLFALGEADAPALASATAVLQDVPHWPTQRGALEDRFERTAGWNAVAPAAAARDADAIRRYTASNCAAVPTPWNDVIR